MRVLGMKKISVYVLIVMIMAIMGYFTYQYYKNKWAIAREKERQETAVRIKEMMQRSALERKERQIAAQEAEKKKAEALIERRKKIAAGTAKTEKIVTYHENGNKSEEYELVEGIKEGLYQSWYENGRLHYMDNYKDGQRHGEQRIYHNNQNQQIHFTSYYVNGNQDGEIRRWYLSGQLKAEGNVSQSNSSQNWMIGWYENGAKEYEERYDSEKAMMFIQYWYPSGVLSRQQYKKNDRRHGKVLYWYPSKAKKIEAEYSNDNLNGWCYMWNEQGELIRKGFYINDILDYDKPYLNEGGKKCFDGINDPSEWPYIEHYLH